ncbi:MAG: hypothetical protein ABSF64_09300 [Bryobacteraceae bacterium]
MYELEPSGQETVLYTFTGGIDGGYPYAGVIRDAAGNLYGTTLVGRRHAPPGALAPPRRAKLASGR